MCNTHTPDHCENTRSALQLSGSLCCGRRLNHKPHYYYHCTVTAITITVWDSHVMLVLSQHSAQLMKIQHQCHNRVHTTEVIALACWLAQTFQNLVVCAVVGQQGMKSLTGKAGKRFWMSEYGSGEYPVTDIKTGLTLSVQASQSCSEICTRGGVGGGRGVEIISLRCCLCLT